MMDQTQEDSNQTVLMLRGFVASLTAEQQAEAQLAYARIVALRGNGVSEESWRLAIALIGTELAAAFMAKADDDENE